MSKVTEFLIPDRLGAGDMRIMDINGDPWFIARDLGAVVGHDCVKEASRQLDAAERGVATCPTPGGPQSLSIVSESGFYKILLRAQRSRPEVKLFQDWVTQDVLPSIRKHGGYMVNQDKMTGEQLLAAALRYADSVIKEKDARITEQADVIWQQDEVIDANVRHATVQKWAAMRGFYPQWNNQKKLGLLASRMARAAKIALTKEPRVYKGEVTPGVNIYPVALLLDAHLTLMLKDADYAAAHVS